MKPTLLTLLVVVLLQAPAAAEVPIVDSWKYTFRRPAEGWRTADFDETGWKEGFGGFGTPETPGSRVGTYWGTNNIWLRKQFALDAVPEQPALLIHHDEDAQVYLNGRRAAAFEGYTTEYKVVPLDAEAKQLLRKGENVLAVHCRQTAGGQFIDVHVVDGRNVPELPPAQRSMKPFESELITKWGEEVTPENAWTEYPRPQLRRNEWQNLNGQWDYAVTKVDESGVPEEWAGKILVPFCLESKLGGVQRLLDPDEALWYRRTFDASAGDGERMLLHFEAVDYECEVWVNGTSVGSHRGGNTPFSFDVTDALRDGENELLVRVEDDTEQWQLRGKQTLSPRGIWYTQVSGIWQTVWLEPVPAAHIEDLTIGTDAASGSITIRTDVDGDADATSVRVVVKDGETVVADGRGGGEAITITVPDAKLWSPSSPHLYNLEVSLVDDTGQVLDRVESYAGIRTVGKEADDEGHLRFTLNGERIFHWGPLDQGWWPDGLLTPPSDEAMVFELEFLKKAGFNMLRKHIKVEPRRYYYHCDRLGLMVWQDQVSAGNNPPWTRLQPDPQDAEWPDEEHEQFMVELERMIDLLESHPSIVVWVPFNEAWGQHRTMEVGAWTVERDPSRLVNVASGGNFWPVGDIVDHHSYPHPEFPFDAERYREFIKVVGEFGGHGYPVEGHLWDVDRRNWGYGGLPKNKEEWLERYERSIDILAELKEQGIAGGVYTQTTDVEGEINGLLTYDRKVPKIPAEKLREISRRLFEGRVD